MNNFELISFPNSAALAQAAAAAWASELETHGANGTPILVALSGGRIARQFFTATAELVSARHLDISAVQFFWGDERCVPPTDPESNFLVARELLFAPLRVADGQIHRVHGEEDPEYAAAQAEAELCRLASLDEDGQPVLDIIFLGMGEDGHVASLFPGEADEIRNSKAVYRPVTAAKPPPHRITLGYRAIAAARHVWVLASGSGKEDALRNSLKETGNTPLARVLSLREQTRIFSDVPLR